jgi:cation diffusion facilitator family transporter
MGHDHDHAHGPAGLAGDPRVRRAATISLAVAVAILAIKVGAWLITGSATVLSDALESVIHVAATLFMAWCARISAAPPDAEHPFGHGRIEFLSAGFEGGAVGLAALGIAAVAIEAWWSGRAPGNLDWGLALVAAAAAVNAGLGWWLLRTGKATNSPLLIADGHHVLSDVWTSLGVLAGVGTMLFIDDPRLRGWCDAGLALVLAGYVFWVAVRLVRGAVAGLLDEADPRLLDRAVAALNAVREDAWRDVHGLRLRRDGANVLGELHLVVPQAWTVAQAHDASERVERAILDQLGHRGTIMVHLDHDGSHEYRYLSPDRGPITVESATRMEA